ncbi:MAG: chitobiase/beta-hexosaminidase C-terminal domain-containing protein [Flammeovirgaceae bacterium]|nr:chitobiase/beta-hexosaminidase C-terminal domain-containing protein [Flammeovirgaceae bacterium]
MKTKTIFLLLAILLFSILSQAQNLPGITDSIFSKTLNEQRKFQVVLPENYDPEKSDQYGVIYLLDGKGNLKLMEGCQKFLQNQGYIPPLIIVAVFNVDRSRDFLPSHMDQTPTSGGAPSFLEFFKLDLIPHIKKNYPANDEAILYGHSFGGVFSTYALLTAPNLFSSYIAVDPSFWWDNGFMQNLAKEKLSSIQGLNKVLFITGREGSAYANMGLNSMDSIVNENAPEDLDWKSVAYPDESHGSVRYKSIYDGLKFAYLDFNQRKIEFHPMNGILLKNQPIEVWNFSDHPDMRYTTDGSEPTSLSQKMEPKIQLSGPVELKVKSFSKRGKQNAIAIGNFEVGETLPAKKKLKKAQSGGLHYSYYEGQWDSLPNFELLKPVKEGHIDENFNLESLPKQENFACVFDGFLKIDEEGYYIFALDSDDGSSFYLGGRKIMEYNGLHGMGNTKSFILPLEEGYYPIKIEFFQKEGGADLQFEYLKPGKQQPEDIPLSAQYSVK